MPASDEELMRQLLSTFKIEADEHIQAMNKLLLDSETKSTGGTIDSSLIEDLFREAHSLKGAAGAVEALAVEAVAHAVETVFAAAKRREIKVTPALFDLLYEALDLIQSSLESFVDGSRPKVDASSLLARLEQAAGLAAPEAKLKEFAQQAKPVERAAVESKATAGKKSGQTVEDTIRVSTRKLDSLMTHVEELLVAKIRTEQRLAELKDLKSFFGNWHKAWFKTRSAYDTVRRASGEGLPELISFLELNQQNLKHFQQETTRLMQDFSKDNMQMSVVTEDLQADIRRVRMLPVASIFDSYNRMVRDLSKQQGKQVKLIIEGSETELDKKVIEGIKDPLLHLLRNAIDHGIESPEARLAKGKSAQGKIWLRATQQGNGIVIEIEDDGQGLNVAKIKETAARKGLATEQELKILSEEEARYLIFQSGFSTAGSISNVSGRGVGMDVVKNNIEQLNGMIEIGPGASAGTKFMISLPLTLSTSRVLLVKSMGETYALPTSAVERIIRVDETEISTLGTKEAINIDGRCLSLVRLGELLELPQTTIEESAKLSVIILGAAEKRVAFVVDSLVGETEVVIKPLGKMMSRVRNVSGATILGTGEVVITLNVSDLIRSSKVAGQVVTIGKHQGAVATSESKSVLVVDDSITTRILEKNILESAGYQVVLANDGIEALEALKSTPCDIIVSDIDMPRMNGLDLTVKIKRDQRFAEMPVILVTSLDSPADRERGLDAGADAYIVKHAFDQRSLLETIEQLT
jgi:two-component system, chemotaxis family, sensor kinase CheA